MAEEKATPFKYLPLILFVLALQSALVYYLLDRAIPKPERQIAAEAKDVKPTTEQILMNHPYMVRGIEPVTVNPAQDEVGHIVQVAVQLGVDAPSAKHQAEENRTRVQDSVTRVLVPRPLEQLRAPAREELKEALRDELNKWLGGHVVEVYFTKFVIQ